MREIVLDIETSGLEYNQGHKIIEIGAIELVDKEVGGHYHQYINPELTLEESNIKIHGITNDYLKNYKTFDHYVEDFIAFIREDKIIAHNANFDIGFINHELNNLGKNQINLDRVIDTVSIARKKFPGQSVSLDSLLKKLKIQTNIDRTYHGALKDTKLLIEVYLNLEGFKQMGFDLTQPQEKASRNFKEPYNELIKMTEDEKNQHKKFILDEFNDNFWGYKK